MHSKSKQVSSIYTFMCLISLEIKNLIWFQHHTVQWWAKNEQMFPNLIHDGKYEFQVEYVFDNKVKRIRLLFVSQSKMKLT